MIGWLIFGIPWQVQVIIGLILAAIILYLVGRIFGFDKIRPVVLPILAVLGAIGLLSRAQQRGYAARKTQEDEATKKAEQVVTHERQEVRADTDAELNKKVDKWSNS